MMEGGRFPAEEWAALQADPRPWIEAPEIVALIIATRGFVPGDQLKVDGRFRVVTDITSRHQNKLLARAGPTPHEDDGIFMPDPSYTVTAWRLGK